MISLQFSIMNIFLSFRGYTQFHFNSTEIWERKEERKRESLWFEILKSHKFIEKTRQLSRFWEKKLKYMWWCWTKQHTQNTHTQLASDKKWFSVWVCVCVCVCWCECDVQHSKILIGHKKETFIEKYWIYMKCSYTYNHKIEEKWREVRRRKTNLFKREVAQWGHIPCSVWR